MAYLYKKVIGGKPYYYLRISKRVDGKLAVKDVAYLGNDLSKIQPKLDNLPDKYKKEIRKGHKAIKKFMDLNYYLGKVGKLKDDTYLSKELQRNVEGARMHFVREFGKLDYQTKMDVYDDFLLGFAYNTTSIEGNTITLKEAQKLLQENLTPKDRAPREVFDLQNTKKAFFYLLEEKPEFNQDLIVKIHDMLLENIDVRKGYRTHNIRVFKSRFKASPVQYIKTDMNLLLRWYNQYNKSLHPLVLASLFHHKFENVHPFSDGNGRTGRIVVNCILLINEYPPLIIQKKNRSEYLRALSEADQASLEEINPTYYKKIVEYAAAELVKSYWEHFNV